MKKFSYIFLLMLALGAVSCASDDMEQPAPAPQDMPVEFGVYTNAVKASTMAGNEVKAAGIGVFALYQGRCDLDKYLERKQGYTPDFMFNQLLDYNTTVPGGWGYAPVKYWPNNLGDEVSFFAYAPYTAWLNDEANAVTPESNLLLQDVAPSTPEGFRLQLGYDHMGPGIEYYMNDDPTMGVDLMWGAKNGASTSPVNLTKPVITDKIRLQMKHALSRLDFDVQVWTNAVAPDGTNNAIPANTTVYIKSVTLKGNFAERGTLRLYDGTWNPDLTSYRYLSFKADKGHLSDIVTAGLDGTETQNAAVALLSGVNATSGADVKNNYVMAIPGAKFCFEIMYDVVTVDPANPANSSVIHNTVCSTDSNAGHAGSTDGWYTIQQGNAYMFHLTIGLHTVDFDASVSPWVTENQPDIELP